MKYLYFIGASLCCAFLLFSSAYVEARNMPYGATAAGTYSSGDTSYVSVAVGDGLTQGEANRNALARCRQNYGRACQISGTFSHGGCGYITSGSGHGIGRTGWGAGPTSRDAYNSCMRNGSISCQKPIGFCTGR